MKTNVKHESHIIGIVKVIVDIDIVQQKVSNQYITYFTI